MAKLTRSTDEAFVNTYCEAYQEEVVVGAQTTWPKESSAEEKCGPSLNLYWLRQLGLSWAKSADVPPIGSERASPSYNLLFNAKTNYTPHGLPQNAQQIWEGSVENEQSPIRLFVAPRVCGSMIRQ